MQRAVPVEQVLDAGDVDARGRRQPMALVPQRVVAVGADQRQVGGARLGNLGVHRPRRLVDRVGRHHPVGGVLAARDHDQAGHRVPDHVLAGELGRGLGLAGQQRPQAGVDALDVLAGQRRAEHRVDVLEQVVDVGGAGGRVRLRQRPVGVGGADDPVPAPRDDEQHALLGAQDEAGVGRQPVARHDQVDALRRPHVELAAGVGQRLGVVGPHAGGVDDLLGPDLEDPAGLQVGDARR